MKIHKFLSLALSFSTICIALFVCISCNSTQSAPAEQSKVELVQSHVILASSNKYAWITESDYKVENALINRIKTPAGYSRVQKEGSFGNWLQFLPLKPGEQKVKLYSGQLKGNQSAQFAVVDIDVGNRDLQQCADATMRLRAEYLYSLKKYNQITFNFTSGDACSFGKWSNGQRPVIGNKVTWRTSGTKGTDYVNFKSYLQTIFTYAGTASLNNELTNVQLTQMQIGDIFLQGGFPGHAVIVVDMAQNEKGEQLFMLAQSYMPAQDIHILKNPKNEKLSPWYRLDFGEVLKTPEWNFTANDLYRF